MPNSKQILTLFPSFKRIPKSLFSVFALDVPIKSEYPLFKALLKYLSVNNPPNPIKAIFPFVSSCIGFNLLVPALSPFLASWK